MYELYDPCTVMFFFRNKHIMVDLGTGNNNKINWALDDKQEMIDLIEVKFEWERTMPLCRKAHTSMNNLARLSRCKKRTWFGQLAQGLLDKVQILDFGWIFFFFSIQMYMDFFCLILIIIFQT